MPFKENDSKKSLNYKVRLERKLCVAQDSPEPVFDLTVCNLKAIPNNVFALCNVLRKEALYLQDNNITNLSSGGKLADLKNLKILNISANKLTKLPSDINELINLEILDVSKNQLTVLPPTIGGLRSLINLNVSYNNLKELAIQIGNCRKLEVLTLTFNENLEKLPVTLGRLHSLVELNIDSRITYPPKDICCQGVVEIIKFLAREVRYVEDEEIPTSSTVARRSIPGFDTLQEQIALLEKMKLEKQNERLILEKQLKEQGQKEFELQQKIKDDKQKLLEDVKTQQDNLDAEIIKLQEKKDIDRAFLMKLCQDEEKKSNEIVNNILNVKKDLQMKFTKEWENERIAEEKMLFNYTAQSRALERKNILLSMEQLMAEEFCRTQEHNMRRKSFVMGSLAFEVSKQNEELLQVIEERNKNKTALIDTLRQNEELQKSAVASLLEKTDSYTWELAQRIQIIEEQLAELTKLELAKRKLESESHATELSKNRVALTALLVDLLDRQTERRNQLVDTIRRMELMKESVREPEIFWMVQYDKLLHSKGHDMVNFLDSVDRRLVYELYVNGVFQYMPLLKEILVSEDEMKNLKEVSLLKHGVESAEDRKKIFRAINSFLESQNSNRIVPAAPSLEEPSAPLADNIEFGQPYSTSFIVPDECVICLEAKPSVIFVPCGHLCCCNKCSKSVTLCPLCRKTIDTTLQRTDI